MVLAGKLIFLDIYNYTGLKHKSQVRLQVWEFVEESVGLGGLSASKVWRDARIKSGLVVNTWYADVLQPICYLIAIKQINHSNPHFTPRLAACKIKVVHLIPPTS